ncbi:MAG: DUF2934 domain-containing protein [Methylobacter sp.]
MATTEKMELNQNPEKSGTTMVITDREARIAELAYAKAERRGFEPGHELDDWLEAERDFMQS